MTKKCIYVNGEGEKQESNDIYEIDDFVSVSSGVAQAYKPILLNGNGKIDDSMTDPPIVDHGLLTGLDDDDHEQYLLVNGSRDMTGGLTIDGSVDEVQLKAQGNATQTENLLECEKSDGTDVFTVDNDGNTTIGDGGAGDSAIYWKVNDALVFVEGIDDDDGDTYKIAGPTGLGNDDFIEIDSSGNFTVLKGLIIPSGDTPIPAIEGALFLDTDAGTNGTLKIYSNGAWRNVAVL